MKGVLDHSVFILCLPHIRVVDLLFCSCLSFYFLSFCSLCIIIYYYWWGGTKSLGTAVTSGLLYKPQMTDEDECGAIGEMKIGTRRKPAPAPLCLPQIPHDQTRARTRAAAVGSQRLTAGASFALLASTLKDQHLSSNEVYECQCYCIINIWYHSCFLNYPVEVRRHFLQNVDEHLSDYKALNPKRFFFS
jgi:hypothetical protein